VGVIVILPERADDHAPGFHGNLEEVSLAGVEDLREIERAVAIILRFLASVVAVAEEGGEAQSLSGFWQVDIPVVSCGSFGHG
jgi:hypothetical protein